MKLKPWMAAAIVVMLYGIVSEMDYRDQVRTEEATVAYRIQNTLAGR